MQDTEVVTEVLYGIGAVVSMAELTFIFSKKSAFFILVSNSAGLPKGINPYTVQVMEEKGISMTGHRS
ncbi:MAG: hypothetical protein DPW09_38010 [Anaerolineae bacterium]|nr:hypothetical protein [Anaerolineae bacterium]